MIQEYLEGNTNFNVTKVPITIDDLPTLVICIESKTENERVLRYGKDFSISTLNSLAHLEENDTNLLATDHLTVYARFAGFIMIKLIC